ncbi:MAG: hypothetical protein ACRDSK_03530 [Actinophytocola sp.]|uniref:hypothetical protein n=1 Tax=Actinophytocola sp. TaxID=1872138 RepID=UPI003D6B2F7B
MFPPVFPAEPHLTATHYTIVVADIVAFGDRSRNNANQVRTRRGLYQALVDAFGAVGVPWHECRVEDRGDGVLILVPANVAKALFIDWLPGALADALRAHNRSHPPEEEIRLRLALHAGEIYQDEFGVTGSSINRTFRILNDDTVKARFAESAGVLAIIGSMWFYDEVIWNSDLSRARSYVRVEVDNKETKTCAWVRIVG